MSESLLIIAAQKLAHIARLMYNLQEYCKHVDCDECALIKEDTTFGSKKAPANWGITLDNIERLKRIEGELRVKVPVEWLKSAVQANKELEREEDGRE